MRSVGVALVVAVLTPAQGVLAQDNVPHTSKIVGIVVDSIHKTGLEGAEVMVSGLSSTVITDSLGRFTVDGIAPGTYQVGVFHPLLESLGLTLTTKPFTVGRDSTGVANLAIPSVETLARRYCRNQWAPTHPAVVAGRVLDPDSDQPVSRASISLAWVDVVVSKETGLVRTPHELRAESDSTGFFKLCGLPEDLDATVQASKDGVRTGEVSVSTHGSPLTFENFALATPSVSVAKGVVRGVVYSLDDRPMNGARVESPISGAAVVTREDGTFTLDGVRTGTQLLVVRRLGFEPTRLAVNVTTRQPVEVRVTMGPQVNLLDPVLVTARANYALEKNGFNARRRQGWGKYFTREDIQLRNPYNLSDMLRDIPGIRVSNGLGGVTISSDRPQYILGGGRGGGCTKMYVDGFEWHLLDGGDFDMFVAPRDVVAMEVYKPGEVPAQYRGIEECIVILVWTR